MVSKKRVEKGSNGLIIPNIPRGPRSRRRRPVNSGTLEVNKAYKFELLASLAEKLLEESESSASSNASIGNEKVKDEKQDDFIASESIKDDVGYNCLLNESPAENDDILEQSSMFGCLANVSLGEGNSGSPNSACSAIVNEQQGEAEGLLPDSTYHTKDWTELSKAFPALIDSDKDVKSPLSVPSASVSKRTNPSKFKLVSRDYDENFSRCYKYTNKFKAIRSPARMADRRMRKLLISRYWKRAPKHKDYGYISNDGGLRAQLHKRKIRYGYEHDRFYKRGKVSDRRSVVTSDGVFSSESVSKSLDKDNKVKFSIKSFKIPDLYVEIPETATVSSLKRTVMEAVTSLLGGGLRVGVVVQGKKIRDDNCTLSQTGISCKDIVDTLGFSLEPVIPKDPILSSPCEDTKPLNRSQSETPAVLPETPPQMNCAESKCAIVPLNGDSTSTETKALVSVEPLAIIPANQTNQTNQKPKRSDFSQRRTRRPFSVSEVEALVHAVEEVGTGRWRDVKLRAFENADHRTYVDLKDKWKTLVHTAMIAPQQRRGEPMPQELLDRVLAAHGYWLQNQPKQQTKPQPLPPPLIGSGICTK